MPLTAALALCLVCGLLLCAVTTLLFLTIEHMFHESPHSTFPKALRASLVRLKSPTEWCR
jgi:hypothetical protein